MLVGTRAHVGILGMSQWDDEFPPVLVAGSNGLFTLLLRASEMLAKAWRCGSWCSPVSWPARRSTSTSWRPSCW